MLNIRAAAVLAALGGALSKAEPTPANNRGWSSFIQYSTYRGAKARTAAGRALRATSSPSDSPRAPSRRGGTSAMEVLGLIWTGIAAVVIFWEMWDTRRK